MGAVPADINNVSESKRPVYTVYLHINIKDIVCLHGLMINLYDYSYPLRIASRKLAFPGSL